MTKYSIFPLSFFTLLSVFNGVAQSKPKLEINKMLPAISVRESRLTEVNTLTDLNEQYPSTWVKEYKSVEIAAVKNGTKAKAIGKSDVLNDEQKELIRSADPGSGLEVRVLYLPNNSLKDNDVKSYDFKVSVTPAEDAFFGEGTEKMIQFLQSTAIENLIFGDFTGYDLTAIKFTISDRGQVENMEVVLPSKDIKMDEMLVEAISKMPNWVAAKYSNGQRVAQDFVLTIGNMENCMATLLNIHTIE